MGDGTSGDAERGNEPRVPGYVMGERLGAGGFGEVFAARREVIERDVAIKILHARYTDQPDAIARFIAEARAVNRVSHPGIVEVFDFGQLDDGRHYVVMERLHGCTLRDLLRERTRLPVDEALPLLRGIAEAIDAAHAAGIAHRDIKPDNVFVLASGEVKLIDFGLAKLTSANDTSVTQTGAVMGTPIYMSPEQCRGRTSDLRTDCYSFGVLAYHVLAGEPPFSGDALELALHHVNDEPEPPSRRGAPVSAAVDRAILALLAKDPVDRPTPLTAAVAAIAGEHALPRRRVRTRRWILAGVAVVGVAGLVATGGWWQREAGGAAPRRSFREQLLEVRFDGLAYPSALSPDGRHFHYQDASGPWRLDLGSRAIERATVTPAVMYAVPLDDGRRLISIGGDRPRVELEETDGRRRHPLLDESIFGEPSPDGRRVAALRLDDPERNQGAGTLVVHELATGETRDLVRFDREVVMTAPTWSPDGRELLWVDSDHLRPSTERIHVTQLDDGTTRVISAPILSRATITRAAAYLDRDTLVYCAESDGARPAAIRTRSLATGRDVELRRIDAGVSTCEFVAAKDRIVAFLTRSEPSLAVIDLERIPATMSYPAGYLFPAALSADGDLVHAYRHDSLVLGRPRASELETVTLSGAITLEPSCAGTTRVIRRDRELVHVELEASPGSQVLRFRSHGACSPVGEWSLPGTDVHTNLGIPRCNGGLCAVAGIVGEDLVVWTLPAEGAARELGRTPKNLAPGRGERPEVAVAADARHVAFFAGEGARVHVVPTSGGEPRAITVGNVPQSVAPAKDGGSFYVATIHLDGHQYGIARVAWDGSYQTVWSSSTTYVGVMVGAATRDILAAFTRPQRQDVLLLER